MRLEHIIILRLINHSHLSVIIAAACILGAILLMLIQLVWSATASMTATHNLTATCIVIAYIILRGISTSYISLQTFIQGSYEISLLLLHVFFVCIPWEIYVFPLLLRISLIINGMEWFFFVKLIESSAIIV